MPAAFAASLAPAAVSLFPRPSRSKRGTPISRSRAFTVIVTAGCDLFRRAAASTLHTDQLRKGTDIPYAAHLLGVASLVLYYGGTETQTIAALLHDSIEDIGPHVRVAIRTRFGQEALDIVNACTDAEGGGAGNPRSPCRASETTTAASPRSMARGANGVTLVASTER
jgi:hypothetical protein